jgi:hypothetical protein
MKTLVRLFVLAALVPAACAQSFNVDVDGIPPSSPGIGVPSATFGGAVHQPGTWNEICGYEVGPFQLLDITGRHTNVFCQRTDRLGAISAWDDPMTSGDFQALMDDGHNTVLTSGQGVTYHVTGLAPGRYVITTYARSPMSVFALTRVTVSGSDSPNPQVVGGPLSAADTFGAGVTHAIHVVTLNAGLPLTITAEAQSMYGFVNGFQISHEYRFDLSQPASGAVITLTDSGGVPGNWFLNLGTVVAGSFPNGPLFGLDIPFADALSEVMAGPPFFGILDENGSATFLLQPPLPIGVTVYCVGLEIDPNGPIVAITPPFSYTIQ